MGLAGRKTLNGAGRERERSVDAEANDFLSWKSEISDGRTVGCEQFEETDRLKEVETVGVRKKQVLQFLKARRLVRIRMM